MYTLDLTNKFCKDVKLCQKRSYDLEMLEKMMVYLEKSAIVPSKYKPHKLKGDFAGCYECHIKPDWLLIWRVDKIEKVVQLIRTGSHSDLF